MDIKRLWERGDAPEVFKVFEFNHFHPSWYFLFILKKLCFLSYRFDRIDIFSYIIDNFLSLKASFKR